MTRIARIWEKEQTSTDDRKQDGLQIAQIYTDLKLVRLPPSLDRRGDLILNILSFCLTSVLRELL